MNRTATAAVVIIETAAEDGNVQVMSQGNYDAPRRLHQSDAEPPLFRSGWVQSWKSITLASIVLMRV